MKKFKPFERELVIKSTTDNLQLVRNFIKSATELCGLTEEQSDNIALAVDEACTNVIKHAYKYSTNGEIVINLNVTDSRFSISITDTGINFDPTSVPEPDIQKYYKQHKVGGLGVYLMRKLMDEVNYNMSSGERNQVTLVKYI